MLGIRETLEKQKSIVIGTATIAIIAAAAFAGWYLYPHQHKPTDSKNYFTDDDGTTWFADDVTKIPPFPHGTGKEAVIARMYQTNDGKPFVGYLEKFTEEGKAKMGATKAAPPANAHAHAVKAGDVQSSGMLVKKPHEGTWVPEEDPAAVKIRTVTAPDGSKDFLPLPPE